MLMSDAKMGAFVSGGIDSSLIASLAKKHVSSDFELFTANIIGDLSEYEDALKLSKALKMKLFDYKFEPHHFIRDISKATWYYETPIVRHANGVPFSNVSELARANSVKAVLTGEGADELFLGYPKLLTAKYDKILKSPIKIVNAIYSIFPSLKRHLNLTTNGFEYLLNKTSQNFSRDIVRNECLKRTSFLKFKEQEFYNQTILMLNEGIISLLWRNDRMGMMNSIGQDFHF